LLPGEYVEALTDLQANVPAVPWSDVEIVIRQQLRQPLEEAFAAINPQAVAAGSIAQTHRATLKNGQEVALKVQRPGIEVIVAQDIALIRSLAELVSRTNFGQDYDVVGLAEEFATALQAELDFNQEAGYTDQLRRNLSTSRWFDPTQLVVPEIYWDLTNKKLMVMEWLDGVPILLGSYLRCGMGRMRILSVKKLPRFYFALSFSSSTSTAFSMQTPIQVIYFISMMVVLRCWTVGWWVG
jgi:ubiquinone biosynthesis protein